jgi:hypothetical protein
VTVVRTWLHRSRPHLFQKQKIQISIDPSYAYPLSPKAMSPSSRTARSLGCHAMPYSIANCAACPHSLRRLLVPLTYVLVTCAARSLVVRLLPIAAGAHMSWRLRSSPAEPRAPMSVTSAGGARAPPVVVVCLVCCNCYIWILHIFASVFSGMLQAF